MKDKMIFKTISAAAAIVVTASYMGMTAMPFSSDMAAAQSVLTADAAQENELTFLKKGGSKSTRDRILKEHGQFYLDMYDKIVQALTDFTANSKENAEFVEVTIDLTELKLSTSIIGESNTELTKLKTFARETMEANPQFYWSDDLNSLVALVSKKNDLVTSLTLKFNVDESFHDPDARSKANKDIENIVKSYAGQVKADRSKFNNMKAINNRLVVETYYDLKDEGGHNQNAYGCLVDNLALCNGYAKAFQLLCSYYDLADCIRVEGDLRHDDGTHEAHAWNSVEIDGKWYFVDVTSNDLLDANSPDGEVNDPEKTDNYLFVGMDTITRNHTFSEMYMPYPEFSKYDFLDSTEIDTKLIDDVPYYSIKTADEFFAFAKIVNEGASGVNAVLENDLDLKGKAFDPIGLTDTLAYKGKFDGQGHTIKNLNIDYSQDRTHDHIGLFGWTKNAEIKNITVSGGSVKGSYKNSGNQSSGAVVGYATSGTVIENCHNQGVSVGGYYAGGVAGYCFSGSYIKGSLKNCSNTGDIVGGQMAGGVVGRYSANGEVTECTNSGSVTINTNSGHVGGIVGAAASDVSKCVNSGNVNSLFCGGIVGTVLETITISDCMNSGTIEGRGAGSLISYVYLANETANTTANIKNCLSTWALDVKGIGSSGEIKCTNVYIKDLDSKYDNVTNFSSAADGEIAYTLNWGQELGKDILPSPLKTDKNLKVKKLSAGTSVVYFNTTPDLGKFKLPEIEDGSYWAYNGEPVTDELLKGIKDTTILSVQKDGVKFSDLAYMTIGESMDYCFLTDVNDEIAKHINDGTYKISMKVTRGNKTYDAEYVGTKTSDGKEYYAFSVDAPVKELNDKMKAVFEVRTSSGSLISQISKERTTADYLYKLSTSSESDKMKNLAAAALNYAAAAQQYKSYNTNSLANAKLSAQQKNVKAVTASEVNAGKPVLTAGKGGIKLKAVTVDMLSKTALRAYFELSDAMLQKYNADGLTFTYTMPGEETEKVVVGKSYEKNGLCGISNGYVWVETPEGVSPLNYDKQITIKLDDATGQGDEYKYSILNYIANKCETKNGMQDVAAAMYRYYQAAK